MDYHLNRDGQNLGIFPLVELSRRRALGELSGTEMVWCAGMSQWEPLDTVLRRTIGVGGPKRRISVAKVVVITVVLAVLAILVTGALLLWIFRKNVESRLLAAVPGITQNLATGLAGGDADALAAASKPVTWTTNTLFPADVLKRERDFRLRQYLNGYKLRGERKPSYDADALGLIQNWLARSYGGTVDTNLPPEETLADKLANNPECNDGLVLVAVAANTPNLAERRRRTGRAITAFEHSKHLAYPKLYATLFLANQLNGNQEAAEITRLDQSAVSLLAECFKDGSLAPGDQQLFAAVLLTGAADHFFSRRTADVIAAVKSAGADFHWLALALEGEQHIRAAWKARGNGFMNTVTPQGAAEFERQLGLARDCLTPAWKLHPEFPLAAERMMYVSLGSSDIGEIRVWFDRAVAAEFEYPAAWTQMRWALRTRWHGDVESELAFGLAALNTGRFDTDVPRGYYESLSSAEDDMQLPFGRHIFDREDIWPNLQRLYEGYIRQSADYPGTRDSWRSTYVAIAYLAGKYEVARKQLETINWSPGRWNLAGWGHMLNLLPDEVAALTGSLGSRVETAEQAYDREDFSRAISLFTDLQTVTNTDARTRDFIRERLAALRVEEQLQKGGWVDLMPGDTNLSGWVVDYGKPTRTADGALEIECGPDGHMLFAHSRVGPNFEIKGEFEVVKSSTKEFQAGLVVGLPQSDSFNWYGFRMRRTAADGDIVSLSRQYQLRQVMQKVAFNEGANSFEFRINQNKVTASVNGQKVFENVASPQGISVADEEFRVGVGAYNDNNDTVIRYRNLQVRKVQPRGNKK